jgi:hypothetical protein
MKKSDQATKVRAYIKANPKAKSSAVAKECGVSVQYVYSLKYQDKRKRKLARKIAPAVVNKLPEVKPKTTTVPLESYNTLLDNIDRLHEMVKDRDAVIAYLEYKLESK